MFTNSNGKLHCSLPKVLQGVFGRLSVPEQFNMKQHYNNKHEIKYGQYHETSWEAILKELKTNYIKQTKMIINFGKPDSTAVLIAPYEAALILAKHGKAF